MAEALIYREFVLRGHGAWSALCAFIKANAADCLRKGKPIRLIVTQDEKKRTSAMNRRYWGPVLKQIAEIKAFYGIQEQCLETLLRADGTLPAAA